MTPQEELILIFGALHLVALALGAILFVMFLRAEDEPAGPSEEDEPGGGGNDRVSGGPPARSPSGGLPLPTAEPARVRLRGHEKLRDAHRRPERRPAREPVRTPARL
jgi:hypothetical protein